MHEFPLPASWGIKLYLKDESAHPSGSLKHRLAHALLSGAIADGSVRENFTLVDASSGSTAISEAYFARLLGLSYVAIIPASTSPEKIALIEANGGTCEVVGSAAEVYGAAERLGSAERHYYLDQFGRAASAYDWDSPSSLYAEIEDQLGRRGQPAPAWVVVGIGTGGTSAAIGRYLRAHHRATRLVAADPEGSVFADAWRTGRRDLTSTGSRIEGIGRPRVEPSFVPQVIDDVVRVPDTVSLAAMDLLVDRTGLSAGASSGTNLAGALDRVARMRREGETGSIVTLLCDSADRYLETLADRGWRVARGLDPTSAHARLTAFLAGGSHEPF